jgi:tetratricopeptide (TPR) repeat protein/tRNA A-37 threonylcarbamoyl transferase component Bud32
MVGRSVLHYRILERIGQGGMGVVYRAEDTKLKRTVALKFLRPHVLSSDQERARFVHEAQAAAALNHPNICTIYEINEADDQTFISMAHLEGESLNVRLERGPLDLPEALRIALQIANGLRTAHEKGVIHRDIKSSNIMLSADGRATIMDFGLAKSGYQSHATKRGTQMGTIAYMSPEQTRGESVDHRTDLWSLGVLLYEMLTGRHPFRGDYDEAVIYSILNEPPEPAAEQLPDAPDHLWATVRRALRKDSEERYQSAADMAEDLEALYEEVRTGSSSRVRRPAREDARRIAASFRRSLLETRVFIALVAYVVVTWFLVRLTGWAVDRFLLSPHLVGIVRLALLSLIPTVWILASSVVAHRGLWSKPSRFVLPLNVLASAGLLLVFFGGRDLGAATETVTVTDEAGHTIERAVPKSEFRKSLMLYFFDNETGDDAFRWVGGATSLLLQVDLYQDQFLFLRSCVEESYRRRLERAGFTTWFETPWNLKRQIAEDAHFDYFVTGSYTRQGDAWQVSVRAYDSKQGRLVADNVYKSGDLFTLIDEASVDLRRGIGVPEGQIDRSQDLPTSEMLTSSLPALRDYCVGIYRALFEKDWSGGVEYMERAVKEDSTFSWGLFTLAQLYEAANVRDKAEPTINAAMQHSYRLPERMQFMLRAEYYNFVQDPEKRLGVAQMMVELYPDDIDAHVILGSMRLQRNERALAIREFEKVLQIDPSRTEYLQVIGQQYHQMGEFERAVQSYEQYLEKYPDDAEVYHALGVTYELQGRYEKAVEQYEKALAVDPSLVPVLAELGDIDRKLGHYGHALETFDRALALSKTASDRARTYESKYWFYFTRGQMQECLKHLKLYWAELEKYQAPASVRIQQLEGLGNFVDAGRTEEAFEILRTIESELAPPWNGLVPLGEIFIYVSLNEPDGIEGAIERLRAFIDTQDAQWLLSTIYWAEGEMKEDRGDYEAAIRSYEKQHETAPSNFRVHRWMGRCYRELGRYEEAVAELQKTLKVFPNEGRVNYETALAYRELGDTAKALEHLNRALKRWENADPEYEPARRARATLAEWQS